MTEPTNQDLLNAFTTHANDDAVVHAENSAFQSEVHEWKKTVATKEDVRSIFAEELKSFFKISGVNTKSFLVGLATVIGALVVIFGGAKAALGWLGFTFMK